jgi:hypothetical protein
MPLSFVCRLLLALASALQLFANTVVAARPTEPLTNFSTEKETQEHCPTRLWLDLPSARFMRKKETPGLSK